MAIKIRCSECHKKVSIDEAFAGGMCRCPYCKAIVYVPEEEGVTAAGARPEAPQARAAAPAEPATEAAAAGPPAAPAAAEHEHIPMARPVMIQGVITIILLALLVVMVAVGVTLALMYIPGDSPIVDIPDDNMPVNPLKVTENGPGLADIKLPDSPIVYVVDGGSSMRGRFDWARVTVTNSIVSLTDKGKFTLLLCREDEDQMLSDDFQPGGEKGKAAALKFLELVAPSGATDVARALKAAVGRKPKAVILIARKVVDDAVDVAKEAGQQGVKIHTISIDGDPQVNESMKALAEAGGGEFRDFYTGF